MRPKCQEKWADQTLDQAFGLPEVLVAVSTPRLSCKRARKTRTLMPVWDSSGESRLKCCRILAYDVTWNYNMRPPPPTALGVACRGRGNHEAVATTVCREEVTTMK